MIPRTEARLIDEWQASGLSLAVSCQRRGLKFGTMQGWAYKSSFRQTALIG